MQQWEHQYVVFSNLDPVGGGGFGQPPVFTINGAHQTYVPDLNVFMTQVGDEGWEMVGMHVTEAGHHHFAFKRHKQHSQEATPVANVAAAVPTIAQGVMARVEKARDAMVERFRGSGGAQTESPAEHSSSIEDDTTHIDAPKDAAQGQADIPSDVAHLPDMFEHPATNSPDVFDAIEEDTEKGETPSTVGESKPD